jgi:serine/threonine protein kinase
VDEVVFGRYRLLSVIGQGGMGTVYKGHDTVIGRDVAVKVLPTELGSEPGYRERFRREAHIAARLTEPHIIPIHDTGEIDGRLYLVMPVIEGIDVAGLLARDGPMSPRRAVAVVDQLAAALDAAHAVGLVHRDVKPSNALLTGRDFVYLIDFGIAHDGAATKLTGTGMIVGTLAYMAPERFTAGTADARSDVYALTCVLHECLTGDQPFPGGSMEQQIAGHLTMDPPRPSAQRAAVPAGFDEVIAAGMAKDPDRRYQSAHELATAADRALTAAPARTPRPAPAPTLHDRLPPQPPPEPVRQPAGDLHLAATHQRPPSWPPGPQPAARRPVLTTLQLWSLIAVIAVTAVVVITIVIRSSAQHPSASQTPTTQPAPSPAPTAQPAPPSQPPGQPASPSEQTSTVPVGLGPFEGTWTAHKQKLVIQPSGAANLSYQAGSLDFTLTSVSNGVASGSITATSDISYQVGEAVTAKITPGVPNGQLLVMTIGGEQLLPMCDSDAEAGGQCGA